MEALDAAVELSATVANERVMGCFCKRRAVLLCELRELNQVTRDFILRLMFLHEQKVFRENMRQTCTRSRKESLKETKGAKVGQT